MRNFLKITLGLILSIAPVEKLISGQEEDEKHLENQKTENQKYEDDVRITIRNRGLGKNRYPRGIYSKKNLISTEGTQDKA